jgi:hypothetical protein
VTVSGGPAASYLRSRQADPRLAPIRYADSGVDEPRDDTVGLVYESPTAEYPEPAAGDAEAAADYDEPADEGLSILGDIPTTLVPTDDVPTADLSRVRFDGGPATEIEPVGATWNQQITQPAQAVPASTEGQPHSFGQRVGGLVAGPAVDVYGQPRTTVRDLPPDEQMRLWRNRVIAMVVAGVLVMILARSLKSWPLGLTVAILVGIGDTIYRARTAADIATGGSLVGARKKTRRQLARMRRAGYFTLDARPIPNSRETIDHLVIGPTGVYAIDSEKWHPRLPVRTWNGKKLYHGPDSKKDRLEHAAWEAKQASDILSAALGVEIPVRPAMAIYGPKIPWDVATIREVDVFTGPALRKYLRSRGRKRSGVPKLTREQVRTIYDTASRVLPDVAPTMNPTPVG